MALEATERQLNLMATHELARMKKMHAYIALRGSDNITEMSDVPADRLKLLGKKMRPVTDHTSEEDQMGCTALADAFHGPARRHEHGSIRRFLF